MGKELYVSLAKVTIAIGAVSAMLSVVFGAFFAHAFKEKLTEKGLQVLEIGAKYQMYHALGMMIIGILSMHFQSKGMFAAGIVMFTGIFVFSGSLYLLGLTGNSSWGALTPVGGVLLIISWLIFVICLF